MAPKKIGPCRGSFPRWHYNAASKKCEGFVFGGCRENLNNYLSKEECTNACSGSGIFSNLCYVANIRKRVHLGPYWFSVSSAFTIVSVGQRVSDTAYMACHCQTRSNSLPGNFHLVSSFLTLTLAVIPETETIASTTS